jgi:glycosyltransferase involved in cell wall biosynthesis
LINFSSKNKNRSLVVGVDASNIRLGGGVTHLIEIFKNFEPARHQISKIVLWAGKETLDQIPDHPWLKKTCPKFLNLGIGFRFIWQTLFLTSAALKEDCSVLFIPGGRYFGTFSPLVTMSQNLLPFEWREVWRYGLSKITMKFFILRLLQSYTLKRTDGIIYLTNYAKNKVEKVLAMTCNNSIVINHGIADKFLNAPKNYRKLNLSETIKVVYVSNIDLYKHQSKVVEAIYLLRSKGYLLKIDFIGPSTPPGLAELDKALVKFDKKGQWATNRGKVSYEEISDEYLKSDLGVFASSCETFGMILLEKMAIGLPVACSDKSSMPEILQDGGLYFDPEDPKSIANTIEQYLLFPELMSEKRAKSYLLAHKYSWKICAHDTFAFIEKIALDYKK